MERRGKVKQVLGKSTKGIAEGTWKTRCKGEGKRREKANNGRGGKKWGKGTSVTENTGQRSENP